MRAALGLVLALVAISMAAHAAKNETSEDEELRSRSGASGSKERARKKRSAKAAKCQDRNSSASGSEAPPAWLGFALDQQTKKVTESIRVDLSITLGSINDNLKIITANQQDADRKIDGLAQQQAMFETTQAKFQMELQLLKAGRSAASSGGGSNGSTAAPAGPSANPYSAAPRILDPARFIVGGWKNAISAVVERQVKAAIAKMTELPTPTLESLDLGGTRMDYCFIKFREQPGHSALKLGNSFKSLLFQGKFPAVGNDTKILWAQPNRTLEARTWRKMINTVRRYLHSIREKAGMALNYEEFGETVEIISGDCRATKRRVAWKGIVVCTFPAEGEVEWKTDSFGAAFGSLVGYTEENFIRGWQDFAATLGSDN